MVDFSVFDSILDAAFVVDGEGRIAYCNDAAAILCQTSVRRIVGKALLSDLIQFREPGILPFTAESQGRSAPTSFIETEFTLLKGAYQGKVQLTIRSVDSHHWAFFLRDVRLEEALHAKYRSELSQKEDYARNLEKLVEARTAELQKLNQTLNAILDSLGQGFFTFDSSGQCGDVYTKACELVLEGMPKGKKAHEALRVAPEEQAQFRNWSGLVFNETLSFEDLKPLGPSTFPHQQGRHVVLDYYPIRQSSGSISEVVVVATDKTTEFEAQRALENQRQYADMIVKFTKNKDRFLQFLVSVRQTLNYLKSLPLSRSSTEEIFRILHTLEGEAGVFSISQLRQLARTSQYVLEPIKRGGDIPADVIQKYSDSLNAIETAFDLFLKDHNELIRLPEGELSRTLEISQASLLSYLDKVRLLSQSDAVYQEGLDLFLKEPVEKRLRYFDGLIQSIGERLNKKIKPLKIDGGHLRIYPDAYEKFFSSVVHAFRNAVDHGLEMPEEREWAGKDPAGQITVTVQPGVQGWLMIIKDDGQGIDPVRIRQKLRVHFPGESFDEMNDADVIQQICRPGFSSRESIGEFSGRGVGLDALKEEVLKMGGTLRLRSKLGEGTEIEIFIPELTPEVPMRRSA